ILQESQLVCFSKRQTVVTRSFGRNRKVDRLRVPEVLRSTPLSLSKSPKSGLEALAQQFRSSTLIDEAALPAPGAPAAGDDQDGRSARPFQSSSGVPPLEGLWRVLSGYVPRYSPRDRA